jgi:hypothetical protein
MIIYTSTKSKQTRKQKQKQKDAWEVYKQKYGLVENKAINFHPKALLKIQKDVLREGAESFRSLPSLNTNQGSTARREVNRYTGDNMIGIAAMHKSNLVPVFKGSEAVEISKMRRG